eukprot:1305022-Amphidinium_carterae.3
MKGSKRKKQFPLRRVWQLFGAHFSESEPDCNIQLRNATRNRVTTELGLDSLKTEIKSLFVTALFVNADDPVP